MSLKFTELRKDGPVKTKEQILAEVELTLARSRKIPKDMRRSYFYDGGAKGDMAHFILSTEQDYLDDVPF